MMAFNIQARDIIALFVLGGIGFMMYHGHNGWIQGIGAVVVTYYFSKRVYEENHIKKK